MILDHGRPTSSIARSSPRCGRAADPDAVRPPDRDRAAPDPRLRAHRDLRPVHVCERQDGLGRAAGRGAGAAAGAPGRALRDRRPGAGRRRPMAATCPRDGETLGEVLMRGNNVMTGYFKDPEATGETFAGGWFHSGDLGGLPPRRLHRAARPEEGHHHLRRREHLDHRGGAGDRQAPGGGRRRGGGHARREMGRAAQGIRRAQARRGRHRRRTSSPSPRSNSPASSARRGGDRPSCPRPPPARSRKRSSAPGNGRGAAGGSANAHPPRNDLADGGEPGVDRRPGVPVGEAPPEPGADVRVVRGSQPGVNQDQPQTGVSTSSTWHASGRPLSDTRRMLGAVEVVDPDAPGHLPVTAWAARRRFRRSPITPIAASSPPPAMMASHGAGERCPASGAVPPKPVAAPPAGMVPLPTASCRLWIRRPFSLLEHDERVDGVGPQEQALACRCAVAGGVDGLPAGRDRQEAGIAAEDQRAAERPAAVVDADPVLRHRLLDDAHERLARAGHHALFQHLNAEVGCGAHAHDRVGHAGCHLDTGRQRRRVFAGAPLSRIATVYWPVGMAR